jgi:hypothetical protein
LAVQRRRDSRREEWNEQTSLAALLAELLDPACIFWTSRPPQAPDVSANRRAATQRWRERQRQRAGDAAQRAAGAQTAA